MAADKAPDRPSTRRRRVWGYLASRPSWVWQVLAAFAALALFAWMWWKLPPWLYQHVRDEATQVNAITDTRTALLAGLVGLGAIDTFWLNSRVYKVTARAFHLTEQGHITERYTKAIEQRGSPQLGVRLGGICALEGIAVDSARDHPTVVEVLSAFVREGTQQPGSPTSPSDARWSPAAYAMTPEERVEWEAGVRALYEGMVRIVVASTWTKLIDFETTLPSPIEELAPAAGRTSARLSAIDSARVSPLRCRGTANSDFRSGARTRRIETGRDRHGRDTGTITRSKRDHPSIGGARPWLKAQISTIAFL